MHPNIKNNFEKFKEEILELKYVSEKQFKWIFDIYNRNISENVEIKEKMIYLIKFRII